MRRSRSERAIRRPATSGAGPGRRAPALLAVVAALAALVVTPAAMSAQGPASPEPPPSQLPVPTGPLFPAPSVDPLDQPSGAGAEVAAPDGSWAPGTAARSRMSATWTRTSAPTAREGARA